MTKNEALEKAKNFLQKRWYRLSFWFTQKEHLHCKLNKNLFFHDLLKIIGLILVFLIVYSNVDKLNQIVLIFIKAGSLLHLVLLFFILRKGWHLIINVKHAYRGFNHGTKLIIAIVIVLLLLFAFKNQEKLVNAAVESYEKIEFQKFNPINANINLSSVNLKGLPNNLNTCPQINVPIQETSWGELNIKGDSYDGWSIKGDATCR